jgi:hypothetical protein
MSGKVRIVHAIDTEGPLYEPIEATFERLDEIFGISDLDPTLATLAKLQRGELDLGDKTEQVRVAFSEHRLSTLGTWDQVDSMLEQVTSERSRFRLPDSRGNGWVFNWFCLDHIGFVTNPRRRDIGFHNVHDRYAALVASQPEYRDTLQWHFHPMSTYREAHRCATHYLRTNEIYEILTRRIIERDFFPSCYRAGFQAERPDSHWFLEQFIPFDISNMATADTSDIDNAIDFRNGRSGNWRWAPSDWSVYHPSHDDYQKVGSCRRLIGRALNLRNRIGGATQSEIDNAFVRASEGNEVLVGLCSHDWRDLGPEVETATTMISNASAAHPNVDFEYCQAGEAFQDFVGEPQRDFAPLELAIRFHPEVQGEDVPFIEVRATQGEVFGPQPFLAIKTRSRRFLHDNFDFDQRKGIWYYAFHPDTLPLDDVDEIGVAANDFMGNTATSHFRP